MFILQVFLIFQENLATPCENKKKFLEKNICQYYEVSQLLVCRLHLCFLFKGKKKLLKQLCKVLPCSILQRCCKKSHIYSVL